MHMMTVKAIADGSGPDITGRTVPMPAGSYHLCREDDRTWFEQRSDVFELQARDDTESPVTATRDASGAVVWLSAGGNEIDMSALALPGYTRTLTGTVIFADGNTLINLGQPITGATLTVSPQAGAAGIDYTADAVPHVSTGKWVEVYGGNVDADDTFSFYSAITGIRIRPIASGADIDYSIIAPGSEYYVTGAISFAGGNVLVTLPTPMAGVSVFVLPSAGEIGVDYTADATPHVSTGAWTELYGGDFAINDSATISARITGLRFRPIATGAAADYIVRR